MKNFRKWITIWLLLGLAGCLPHTGTAQQSETNAVYQDGEEVRQLSIIATVFPAYDFAKAIVKDAAQVHLLLPPGTESHTYEPTPQDVLAVQQADLFLYVGGESEQWVTGMLAAMGNDAPRALTMMDCVQMLEEEHSASMEPKRKEAVSGHREFVKVEMDEHVWTSPQNAMLITMRYAQVLQELDAVNAKQYAENAEAYLEQLAALDVAFGEVVNSGMRKKIIFGDRFPFRYFAHTYDLAYDAAFPGCSEESEPSIQTIASLIGEIKRDSIPVVFYIEFSDKRTANILAEETEAKLLLMHSCHTVSRADMESGVSYLSLMWENVAALKEALH